jgi:hypothetical protein
MTVTGVLAGYTDNSDNQEHHTRTAPIHSIKRQRITPTGYLLMYLHGWANTLTLQLLEDKI